MCQAVEEIEGLITSWYPTTTFAVTRSADPPGIRVLATVDVDDIDEVLDLSIHWWSSCRSRTGCHSPPRLGADTAATRQAPHQPAAVRAPGRQGRPQLAPPWAASKAAATSAAMRPRSLTW